MYIENEIKLVLYNRSFDFSNWQSSMITQHYLLSGIRTRCEGVDGECYYTVNYKTKQSDYSNLEQEYEIDKSVYDLLNKRESQASLTKIRYSKQFDDELWSIDFFLDSTESVYFVLAECEMPEGRLLPVTIPKDVSDNMLYIASRRENSSLLSSYRLADVSYATQLLESLSNGS